MKPGDIIEWRAVNAICSGIITESDNGELVVAMDNGHSFPLDDLLNQNH